MSTQQPEAPRKPSQLVIDRGRYLHRIAGWELLDHHCQFSVVQVPADPALLIKLRETIDWLLYRAVQDARSANHQGAALDTSDKLRPAIQTALITFNFTCERCKFAPSKRDVPSIAIRNAAAVDMIPLLTRVLLLCPRCAHESPIMEHPTPAGIDAHFGGA